MKQLAILLFILFQTSLVKAQYTFISKTTPYQELSNPISLNQGQVWNNGSYFPVYFNFNFSILGQNYTAVNVKAGGGLNFPGLGMKELFVFHTPFGGYLLSDKDSVTSESDISYEVSGTAGQQILKVQWKNAGFVQWYTTSDTNDFVDFQVWLFEADNHIEVHFGPSLTDPGTYGFPNANGNPNPGSSFKFWFDSCSNVFGLSGPANLPSYLYFNSCTPNYVFIDGTPSNGMTYILNPPGMSIDEYSNIDFSLYPNPAAQFISVSDLKKPGEISHIQITNNTGTAVLNFEKSDIAFPDFEIQIEFLPDGVYFLNVYDNEGNIKSEKFIKLNR